MIENVNRSISACYVGINLKVLNLTMNSFCLNQFCFPCRLFEDAANKLNMKALVSFLKELCISSQQQLATSQW